MDYPKLRYIDSFPVEHKGSKMVCLRDPQNTTGKMLLVSPEALYIISHFNGKNSIRDIQTSIVKRYGNIIYREQITELVHQLDEALLLDSDNYKLYQKRKVVEFNRSAVRNAAHAGLSYPAENSDLNIWIDSYFKGLEFKENKTRNPLKGLISPHIDLGRGGKTYAKAYWELINNQHCETFFIFGTSHYADVNNPFILCRKNYITPYGEVKVNQHAVDFIENSCEWDLFEGEIFHRDEHSIEFQILFLQYMLKDRDFTIVPILCGSFHNFIKSGTSPARDGMVSQFLATVKDYIIETGDKAVVIAGADLAHIGLKFGDGEAVSKSTLNWIRNRDMISINFTENIDAEGFYSSVAEEKDKRKICGLSPIYALLKTVNAETARMLDYGQALEPETGSVVSYTSVTFY